MGMAARVGDPTAHGGAIMPPGCVTVLIGKMPAARLTDLQSCPLVTPVGPAAVPHAVGPILGPGSATVLIGGMPAACQGDSAMCTPPAPPSSIIMGCPTVMIGMSGGGGGGGGGAGAGMGGSGSATKGAITSAALANITPGTVEIENHFLNVSFQDKGKLPVTGYRYTIKDPDGKTQGGTLSGEIKRQGVAEGDYEIILISITAIKWSKDECKVNEELEASFETVGIKDGTKATFQFFMRDLNCTDQSIGEAEGSVSGDKCKTKWKFPEDKIADKSGNYSSPEVFFKVSVGQLEESSPIIPVYTDLEITLKDEDGQPASNEEVEACLSSGAVVKAKTDSSGKAEFKKVPPTTHTVKFLDSPRAESEEVAEADPKNIPVKKKSCPKTTSKNTFVKSAHYFYCGHKIDGKRRSVKGTDLFEVVPDFTGENAYKDKVIILSNKKDPVTASGDVSITKKESPEFGNQAYELECVQDFDGVVPQIWKKEFWQSLIKPKEYQIKGLSKAATVKCYAPDQFKLQIKFPSMRKCSGGTKVEAEKTKGATKTAVQERKMPPKSSFEYTSEEKGWKLGNKIPKPLTTDVPIVLQRNNSQLSLSFLDSVGAIIDLANKVQMIINEVTTKVPKFGWYFTYENQFFEGTFVVEWGWKEYKDHRAYFYIGTNIDMKLISMKMELGIGISGFACAVQVFGSLTGELTISLKICRISPDGDGKISLPFSTAIVGALGIRFKVGFFFELEGVIETALKLEGGAIEFSSNEGVSVNSTLKWTGIQAKVKGSASVGKKEGVEQQRAGATQEKVFKLIDEVEIGKWNWPKQAEYNPPVIPADELHKMMVKKLTEGDNIRVVKKSGAIDKHYSMDEVAQQIEKRIHQRNDIRKDPKTAEALIFDIRKYLESKISRSSWYQRFKSMPDSEFKNFLNLELKNIMHKYIDPLQTVINQNSQ